MPEFHGRTTVQGAVEQCAYEHQLAHRFCQGKKLEILCMASQSFLWNNSGLRITAGTGSMD